jgi:hypothetical protein
VRIPTEDGVVVFPAQFPVSSRVLDSHGLDISGVTIQLVRGGKTKEIIGNESRSVVSVPPGVYQVSVLSADGTVIGQRMLDVVGDRTVDLITTQEPLFPWIVLLICLLLVFCGLGLSILKKDLVYLSMFLVVSVGVASLVFPWWSLQGSSAGVQTSSQLYLVPLNLVSMTTASQVIAGELSYFPEVFVTAMSMVVGIMALGWCCIGVSLLLRRVIQKRWFIGMVVVVCGLLIISLGIFMVAMSAFTKVGVGSFLGQGTLDVPIQEQERVVPVLCQWEPGMGFWLYVLSLVVLVCSLLYMLFKKR